MTKQESFNNDERRITNAMDAAAEKRNATAKRTPGIWDYGFGDNSKSFGIFTKKMLDEGLEESPICLISPIDKMDEVDKANAAFIVKAVNNHDAILEALKEMVNEYGIFADVPENYKELEGYPGDENPRTSVMIKAIEAIQQCEGKETPKEKAKSISDEILKNINIITDQYRKDNNIKP